MSKLRNIFIGLMAFAIIAMATLSVNAYAHGDKVSAKHYAGFALAGMLAPVGMGASVAVGFTPGIMALSRNSTRFGVRTQLDQANIYAVDDILFIRKSITSAGGIKKLIDYDTTKTAGITTFDGNKLPEGENFAIEAIRIAEGNHATITDPAAISNYTNVVSSVQVEVRNAYLVIAQENKELVRLAVSALMVQGAGLRTAKEEAFKLDNPPVLIENKPIQIFLELPAVVGTTSTSTNKFHIEVMLFGKKTTPKAV
jgi:hypothetical protein